MAMDRQAAQAQKQDTGSTNPGKDLILESITASGIQSPEYTSQIESYKKASYYIAVAYLAAECSLFFLHHAQRGVWVLSKHGVVERGLCVYCHDMALHRIHRIRSTGLQATLGLRVCILSFIGFAESLLAAIALAVQSARSKSRKPPQRILGRGSNLQDPSRGHDAAKGPHETAFVKPGFMRRVKTWNRHEYTQAGKRAVIIHRRTVGPDEDHQDVVAAIEGDDFSHEYPDDIAMGDMPPARNSSRDRDQKNHSTVYDPYSEP
ncbi:hypothetical protein SUNI508_00514 [Seiridium unicorne]|uniref:Uncharacterized protein n=1 Tax=Seiridium unicorne TaxID=138068 RepID=A0ABR2V809_9PEZI